MLLALLLALAASRASAQSDQLSSYGRLDLALSLSNSRDQTGDRLVELMPGVASSSRIGVRGSETLAAGLQAQFQIEGGINPDTGSVSRAGAFSGRSALLGLRTAAGSLSLGLQNTPIVESFEEPFGWANLNEGGFLYANYLAKRWENALRLGSQSGALDWTLLIGLGEQVAPQPALWNAGASLSYRVAATRLALGCQQMRNALGLIEHRACALSAQHRLGRYRVYAGWLGHESALAPQRNEVWSLGLAVSLNERLDSIAALYDDRQQAPRGEKRLLVLMLSYRLSHSTLVYLQTDAGHADDGYARNRFDNKGFALPPGLHSRLSLLSGLRLQW